MDRRWDALLGMAACVVLAATIVRVPVFWSNEAYMDSVAGIWHALADDAAHGVIYRPVESPAGFGGTRYAPVQFVLHAGLARAFQGDLVRAGHALALAAMLALMAGAYLFLRRVGLTALTAASAAALILASHTAQEALLSYKGDLLPAAFNVWGLAICAAPALGTAGVLAAAAAFSLAFGAKVTTVFGLFAVLASLWASGQRRAALRLLAMTAVGAAALYGAAIAASDGHMIDAWRAGASGAGNLKLLLKAPFAFARLVRQVPETLVFVQLGLAALLALNLPRVRRADLASWHLLAVIAVTIAICSADGADTNHFLDLHVASILVAGAWLVSVHPEARAFGVAALAVAGLAAAMSLGSGLVNRQAEARKGRFVDAVARVGDTSRPILAENPLVPITAGQRPYMLDPFVFRMSRAANPALEARLWQDLAARKFSAVVLERDPHTLRGEAWYGGYWFGAGFIDQMERFYEEAGRVGERVIYRPKTP